MKAPAITHSLVSALRAVPSLASLDDHTLLTIVGASANLLWRAGGLVFEKGSEADGLYIVLSGRVRILDVEDGKEIPVVSMGPGDFFGELSLILNEMHSKRAVALEDSELMVIPKESFRALIAAKSDLAAEVRRTFEQRMPDRDDVTKLFRLTARAEERAGGT